MKKNKFYINYTSIKITLLTLINILILILYLYYYNTQIYNCYKIYIISLILNSLKNNIKLENNTFNLYYFNYSGKLDFLHLKEKNYHNVASNNSGFLTDLEKFEKGIDLAFLKVEKTKIENIIILIFIFPFLKKNSTVFYQIKNKKDYNLFHGLFKVKNKKYLYKINKSDLYFLMNNFNNSIYYDWEIILENELTNELRYLINNYYNETFLKIFDNSLNLNFNRYIKKKRSDLTINKISILMSKLLKYNIIRKYRNI